MYTHAHTCAHIYMSSTFILAVFWIVGVQKLTKMFEASDTFYRSIKQACFWSHSWSFAGLALCCATSFKVFEKLKFAKQPLHMLQNCFLVYLYAYFHMSTCILFYFLNSGFNACLSEIECIQQGWKTLLDSMNLKYDYKEIHVHEMYSVEMNQW